MKKLFLSLAAGVFLSFAASSYAAPQADSCLKLACPNDYDYSTNPNGWLNRDSLRIDSCLGSPTYLKLFAFRYYELIFELGKYPFDNIIQSNETKLSSEISSNQVDFKNAVLNLEKKYCKLYFIREAGEAGEIEYPDSSYISSPLLGLYLEKYVLAEEFLTDLKGLPGVTLVFPTARYGKLGSAVEDQTMNIKSPSFTPNPVKNKLTLLFDRNVEGQKIKIVNIRGTLVKEIDFTKDIDVSDLSSGIYFLQTNDQEFKFVKE